MGENKHIDELDAFTKASVNQIQPEKTSKNFTNAVMQAILKNQSVTTIKYEPLISKKVWFFIIAAVLSLLFLPFEKSGVKSSVVDKVDLSVFDQWKFATIFQGFDFSLPNSAGYALLFCAVMVLIQVVVLKNYFSGKLY